MQVQCRKGWASNKYFKVRTSKKPIVSVEKNICLLGLASATWPIDWL